MSEQAKFETSKFETWAIVELFGHQRVAGRVSEQTIGGCAFIRVDVPKIEAVEPFTKFYTQGAIYCMTPTDEATAIAAARSFCSRPISPFVIPESRRIERRDENVDYDEAEED